MSFERPSRRPLKAPAEGDYVAAIVGHNCLGKPTAATRVLSAQRLSEAVRPRSTCRSSASCDPSGHSTKAPSPCLPSSSRSRAIPAAFTAPSVVALRKGDEFARGPMRQALREAVGDRLSGETLDKVARNAASSWSQAGLLTGRTFKFRQQVEPTFTPVALALLLAATPAAAAPKPCSTQTG